MAEALSDSGIPPDAMPGVMQSHPVLRDNWYVVKKLIEDYLGQPDLPDTRV